MQTSLLIGLTGGIAAGKSTVARALSVRGARIVDGDDAARSVVDRGTSEGRDLLTRVADLLGPRSLTQDGDLDRAGVAERIFADEALRQAYTALLRPAILAEVARRIADARRTPGVIVHEVPLLTRTSAPLPWHYDLVVTVEADDSTRVQRLQQERGHSADEALRRIRAQGAEADRIAIADVVLRTDIDLELTMREIDALWSRLSAGHPLR